MKLNQLILLFFASLLIVISFGTQASSKERNQEAMKPICLTEKCFGEGSSDIIVFDPIPFKAKFKDLNDNRQVYTALSEIAFGAKINAFYSVQQYVQSLHILYRQLLL
jgi:hypothetical protein